MQSNWTNRDIRIGLMWMWGVVAGFLVIGMVTSGQVAVVGVLSALTSVLVATTAFVVLLLLYFAPALVAKFRRHRNFVAIAVLNLLVGWTLIGWIVLLGWSLLEQERGGK